MTTDSAKKQPRVFVGPTETAGYFGQLAIGLRNAGVDACFVPFSDHAFDYPVDERPFAIPRMLCWARRKRSGGFAVRLCKTFLRRLNFLLRLAFFIQALVRFDTFVFGFGRTIFNWKWPVDLWILRNSGKRIVFVYLGSDSRPPWLDILPSGDPDDAKLRKLAGTTVERARRLKRQEAFADVVVVNPLSAQHHRKRSVNWFRIGIPKHVPGNGGGAPAPGSGPLVAVHAPSRARAKGTEEIRRAVKDLNAEGIAIELVELQGQPNKVVLDTLRRCDFAIDQCYSDTPMAGFAAEAASMGRPSIVGGYELDRLMTSLPEEDAPPTICCHPEALKATIRELALDEDRRREAGLRARAFLEKKWHRDAVGRRFRRLIDGDIPDDWWFNPADCDYFFGGAATEQRRRAFVQAMVARFGPASLYIDDKPALRDVVLEWASGK